MKLPRDVSGDELAKLLKIGTLSSILEDIAKYLEISKESLIKELF
jgi:hypothetical protein